MRQTQQQRDYDRDEDYDKDWVSTITSRSILCVSLHRIAYYLLFLPLISSSFLHMVPLPLGGLDLRSPHVAAFLGMTHLHCSCAVSHASARAAIAFRASRKTLEVLECEEVLSRVHWTQHVRLAQLPGKELQLGGTRDPWMNILSERAGPSRPCVAPSAATSPANAFGQAGTCPDRPTTAQSWPRQVRKDRRTSVHQSTNRP